MSTQVRVVGHYRVLYNGQAYTAGDGVVEVPYAVARRWQLYGWADPVDDEQTKPEQAEAKPRRQLARRQRRVGATET